MANISPADVIWRFNTMVKDRANSGISWGTNNYPANSIYGWFGGDTGGVPNEPSYGQVGSPGPVNAAKLRDAMLTNARLLARVKKMRIVIYRRYTRSGQSNSTETIYDGTAIAHAASQYAVEVATPATGGMLAGRQIRISDVDAYMIRLWANVLSARNRTTTLTNTVCHNSCHNSCHSSGRGRR